MSSSLKGKLESPPRLVSNEEAVVFPDHARPTDDTPTVISKTQPIVESAPSHQDKIIDLAHKPITGEAIVASLRGRRLAHYELIEPIGVGGMAAVIRARDTQLDRFVALKILPPEMALDKDNVERFRQEGKAAAKLDHANIARVFYCGEDQGLHFIAFEFVEGVNLRILMEQRGRLPVAESVRYILQIAAGLEHAASRGVVHRDVKPSNIIITPDGQAKLVDMGLARNLDRTGQRDLTQSGVTLGTFDYISPEQALEPREADVRSDIYSLGCTFYHMLTGQTSVPEGTPAKKLDHHQHQMPTDPRKLNPAVPDEIVMILGKMMAKNPRDRYQRPIHLVQHLMQVAQQVGAANDAPGGVLFVDAPLPTQSRSRPVLYIGMALATLVAVTLFLSFALEQAPKQPVRPPNQGGENPVQQPSADAAKPTSNPVPSPAKALPEVIRKAEEFLTVIGDRSFVDFRAKIEKSIDLTEFGKSAFVGAKDQRLVLESKDDDLYRTIRFWYDGASSPVGLVIEGGREIVFTRIKFQIDIESTPEKAAAAIAIRGAKVVRFDRCLFVQNYIQNPKVSGKRAALASVLIDAPEDGDNPGPVVNFNDCYFDGNGQTGGQDAVAINGAASVKLKNCAFRPHGAFFSFREKCRLDQTSIHLENCVGLVAKGPAFRLHKDASASVDVEHSVFSRPGGELALRDGFTEEPGLIFLAGDGVIRYKGRGNLYHNLNAFVQGMKLEPPFINTKIEFEKYLKNNNGGDFGSNTLEAALSPLDNGNPLGLLPENPLAFRVKEPHFSNKVGLLATWEGPMEPPPAPVAKLQPKKKIVDGDDDSRKDGEYRNVAAALQEAVDGDIIFIKHGDKKSFEVPVSPVALKPGRVITLKPHKDCKPTLVIDKDFEHKSALFTVEKKSKLHIEDMNIVLEPKAGLKARSLSVVQMGEEAHVVFKHCLFGLRPAIEVDLSVVSFLEFDAMMKMEGPAPKLSQVEFHDCFVRGKGDLVALPGCRKLDVKVTDSLIALDGSLLDIRAGAKLMPTTDGVTWTMTHSSVFTSESIFALHTEPGMVMTKTTAKITDCLLMSLADEQPIVKMPQDDNVKKYLNWQCDHNYYANFDKDKIKIWNSDFFEPRSLYVTNGLTISPKLDDLWNARPEWFRPTDEKELERIKPFGLPADADQKFMAPAPTVDEN